MKENTFIFKSVIIKEDAGYTALCIDIDVASEGETIEETKTNLTDAVSLYVESAIESNLPILRPIPFDENPIYIRKDDIVEYYDLKISLKVEVYA
jgi:predicted RNase H-like HicB family nuclease